MCVREEHLPAPGPPLLAAGEERVLPALERVAMRDDGGDVDPPPSHQIEIDLHGVTPFALELLDAERVRPDDRDLLEVERRPLEAARHLDAGDDDRAPRRRAPDADLDRLRIAPGIVHEVAVAPS